MRKPGTDPDNVRMSDVLCDFCHRAWTDAVPMIEGHQGSIICGRCMTIGYSQVIRMGEDSGPAGYRCTMCLEHRDEPAWQSPAHPEAIICRRCLKLGAGALVKDPDAGWSKPSRT